MTLPASPPARPTRCCSISVAWCIDIDFGKALACWAGHAGCDPSDIVARFVRDETYRQHEIGQISDADYL